MTEAMPPKQAEPQPTVFYTDYGKYGQLSISLPPFVGNEDEYDEEWETVLTFMTSIMKRRKRIAARIKAEEHPADAIATLQHKEADHGL